MRAIIQFRPKWSKNGLNGLNRGNLALIKCIHGFFSRDVLSEEKRCNLRQPNSLNASAPCPTTTRHSHARHPRGRLPSMYGSYRRTYRSLKDIRLKNYAAQSQKLEYLKNQSGSANLHLNIPRVICMCGSTQYVRKDGVCLTQVSGVSGGGAREEKRDMETDVMVMFDESVFLILCYVSDLLVLLLAIQSTCVEHHDFGITCSMMR